jgi:hypothetical protein
VDVVDVFGDRTPETHLIPGPNAIQLTQNIRKSFYSIYLQSFARKMAS